MTEDKPIAKPIIDDATREKMALLICRPPNAISSLNSTPHR